jgi:hypothetical protein
MAERRIGAALKRWVRAFRRGLKDMADTLTTTATYGRGFKPSADPDTFSIRIYVSAAASPRAADRRFVEEVRAFREARGYKSHETLDRRYRHFPLQYCEYRVKFGRA